MKKVRGSMKIFKLFAAVVIILSANSVVKADVIDTIFDSEGDKHNNINTFFGYHNHLYGYKDKRYVAADKGDYLKTNAYYLGAEYRKSGFEMISPEMKNLELGGNVNMQKIGSYDSKTLYAVPSLGIPQETFPSSSKIQDRVSKFYLNIGFYAGWNLKWLGFDFGLTGLIDGYNEEYRKKVKADATVYKAKGRGWVTDGGMVIPNFHFRIGPESFAHFNFSFMRGHYDPTYGKLIADVVIPLNPYFSLKTGAYLYQTEAIFVEPILNISSISLGMRFGTILSYNDSKFTRVGITEGLFISGSVAAKL